jgi:hypothetical protein
MSNPAPEQQIVLDEKDKQILDFALKVGKTVLRYNPDLKPSFTFLFSKKEPNKKVVMVPRNEDCSMFLSAIEYQLHDKFIIDGEFDRKIYYVLFKQLGLIRDD